MIMSKKGTSSTEMIISFGLFITFLLFMFIYINPLKTAPTSSLATALEVAVKENATIELEKWGFAVNKTLLDGVGCFQINNSFSETDPIFITDEKGNKANFKKSSDNQLTVEKLSKFYYAHKGINGTNPSYNCIPKILVKEKEYSWSVPIKYTIYYNRSLAKLKEAYDSDYNSLKQNFKLPASAEFSIVVSDSERNEIIKMTKTMPRVNIISREFPIEILSDESGIKIMKGYLRLIIW